MVGDDILRGVEPEGGDLVEDLALIRNALGEDDVEGGDAVGGDHHEIIGPDAVHVTDLAGVLGDLAGEMEISAENGFHNAV